MIANQKTERRFEVEPLTGEHNRHAFHCGVEALDQYFEKQAGQDSRKRVAAPFVLVDQASSAIVGYYTLSMCSLLTRDLPEAMIKKLPRYEALPAVLLGRLAVDRDYQGKGLGAHLLIDALYRAFNNPIAAAFVVVDAIDDSAKAFYLSYGFIELPNAERRLFLAMKTIAALIETKS